MRLPVLRGAVSAADVHVWAALLADDNPLHDSAAASVERGMGHGLVTPGPASIGFVLTALERAFPGGTIEALDSRFLGPVLAPTSIEVQGSIDREESTAEGRRLHCTLELRAAGACAVVAQARVWQPVPPAGAGG